MSDSHVSTFVHSVIPIVTKCKPNIKDPKNNKDSIYDEVYGLVSSHFNLDITDEKEASKEDESPEDFHFINEFNINAIIYDPLDRPILDDNGLEQ